MFEDWRNWRAARRVKPGDGRPLKPFRWWQLLGRSLLYLRLPGDDGRKLVYAVDVRHSGNASTGEVEANLYLDGVLHAVSKLPAAFPVPGGVVQVAVSTFGLKRCHFVADDGAERMLEPDPRSAEGRRAQLDRAHPSLSRAVGAIAVGVLAVSVALLVPQLLEYASRIPPIAENFGVFASPVQLSFWANVAITAAAAVASTDRALRIRYHWLLDGAGN